MLRAIILLLTISTRVTLSRDGKILYVGNERKILAYDLNRNGQASHTIERVPDHVERPQVFVAKRRPTSA